MDDVFTLLRQAVDLLPEDVAAENGETVGDVREDIVRQEWEMVLGVLIEIGMSIPCPLTTGNSSLSPLAR